MSESIERTRALMQQCRTMNNPQAVIYNLLQQNPQLRGLSSLLRNGYSLEDIANSMAQTNGYDINEVIKQLGGA